MSKALLSALQDLIDERIEAAGVKGSKKKGKDADDDDDDGDEITEASLKEKLLAYAKEDGKAAAKKLLKKFKVEQLSDLDEDKYEDFNSALDKLSGGKDDDDDDDDKKRKGKGKKDDDDDDDDMFGDD
jgi:hypothetical protein